MDSNSPSDLSPDFFRKMVESVGVGVGIYGQNGQYIYVNEAYAELFSVSSSDLIGVRISELATELDSSEFDTYWESFDNGDTREAETVHEYNNHRVPVETITTQRTIGGTAYHFGTIKDITQRKAKEDEIKQQNERLERFSGIVSHDLRNPLNIAQGYVDLLQKDIDRDELRLVDNSLRRMESLITELLQLARNNKPVGETERVSLFSIAQEAWDSVDTVDAELQLAGSDTQLLADRSRLKGLFENSFRNAVEHGGEDVKVLVDGGQNGFCVADNGVGIPSDHREKVFEAGFSTNTDGTGFGLSIIQQIVNGHDWEIQVTEGDSGGAQFEVFGVEVAE